MAYVLRCIHRHTIEEHPACFAQGKILLPPKVKNVKFKKNGEVVFDPWWANPEYKIGYLDIETDNLNANFGKMLTWALKEKGGKTYYGVITKKEIFNYTFDKRITEELLEKLKEFKIIIGYYSKRFDIPFIRTRAVYWGLDTQILEYRNLFHWDLYDTIKRKFRFHRNTLEIATRFFDIEGEHGGKNHVEGDIWEKARYGDKKALKYVLDHNIRDVEILELLHEKVEGFSSNARTSI